MIKILVFEDDNNDRDELIGLLKEFFEIRDIQYQLDCSEDENFLIQKSIAYDFIFLDIEVNLLNGIEIGKKIREINAHTHIIIVSSFQKYLVEGYTIGADRYFLKPIQKEIFNKEMENVLNRYFQNDLGIMDPKVSKTKIWVKDILYVDFSNRKSFIKLVDGEDIKTPYTLSYWEEKLVPFHFCRCNRFFLVNLHKVDSLNRTQVILENGDVLDLSRKYRDSFETKWIESVQRTI
ncbi:MAG: LytTR family DNA-binding domain-containing protein [Bacillota bacterium]|nr:LytTR family DNA-binding domain-containing protein [Bacillota bacterium]